MADNCFPKENRLLSANDFNYLKSKSLFLKNRWLKVYFKVSKIESSNNIIKNSRIGISASRKVGKANIRNICKRTIRESFRSHHIKVAGQDILVIVSPFLFKSFNTKDEAQVELQKSIHSIFDQIALKVKKQ